MAHVSEIPDIVLGCELLLRHEIEKGLISRPPSVPLLFFPQESHGQAGLATDTSDDSPMGERRSDTDCWT